MIITKKSTSGKGFTVMARSFLYDRKLGIAERGVLGTALSRPANWRFSISGMAAVLPNGKDSIRTSVGKLETVGYLQREKNRTASGCFAGENWRIVTVPQTSIKNDKSFTTKMGGQVVSEYREGQIKIDNIMLYDASLSTSERGLMMTLLSLPANWDCSVAGLTRILPDGKSEINAAVVKLEAKGYLIRQQNRNAQGLFDGEIWILIPDPQGTIADDPKTEIPPTDNRKTEKATQVTNHREKRDGLISERKVTHTTSKQSINQSPTDDGTSDTDEEKAMWQQCVRDQIDYDLLRRQLQHKAPAGDLKLLDLAVDAIVVLYSKPEALVLSQRVFDVASMREQAEKMDARRIGDVLLRVWEKEDTIKNLKRYLLRSLLNEK